MDFEKQHEFTFNLDPSIIEHSLKNLNQLVFEVTSCCNLQCEYCGYGELYNERRTTHLRNMNFEMAKAILDYLLTIWDASNKQYDSQKTCISFYGGEPLLNFDLIKKIIQYVDSISQNINRSFYFTMTTNAVLLDKYMHFLAEKKFRILISLDGDETAHSYRIDHVGKNSFSKVIKNVELLQTTYPDYFKECVEFNSVLTNKTTFFDVKYFIYNKFSKYPMVSEVNPEGVIPAKNDKFNIIHRSAISDFKNIGERKSYVFFQESPEVQQTYSILRSLSGNSFNSYDELLCKKQTENKWLPTGTCYPFSRKLFLTVNGDILPCERINQKFILGTVSNGKVILDYERIASYYSGLYRKLWIKQCSKCYMKNSCQKCMFYIDDLDIAPKCIGFKNKKEYTSHINRFNYFLLKNPETYEKIMKELF